MKVLLTGGSGYFARPRSRPRGLRDRRPHHDLRGGDHSAGAFGLPRRRDVVHAHLRQVHRPAQGHARRQNLRVLRSRPGYAGIRGVGTDSGSGLCSLRQPRPGSGAHRRDPRTMRHHPLPVLDTHRRPGPQESPAQHGAYAGPRHAVGATPGRQRSRHTSG